MADNREVDMTDDSGHEDGSQSSEHTAPALADSPPPDDDTPLTLELSPIEQRAPRCYNRIAVVVPWNRLDGILPLQFREVMKDVKKALFHTFQHWPFLAGCFKPSDDDPAKIELHYKKLLDEQQVEQLVTMGIPPENWEPLQDYGYHLAVTNFDRGRFVWEQDPQQGDRFPPVTIKISLVNDNLVLGFAFAEILFDGEAIRNFFTKFFESQKSACPRIGEADCRAIPDPVEGEPDLNLFPCYDWSSDAIQAPTPRQQLRFHIISLPQEAVQIIFREVTDLKYQDDEDGVVLYEDAVLAFVWVLIMRARFKNDKVVSGDICRVNYSFPGGLHTRSLRSNDPEYCGNSTGTVVAECDLSSLIQTSDDLPDYIPKHILLDGVLLGAQLLRHALQGFGTSSLHQLSTLKRTTDPEEERTAYERALKRSTKGLVFEDWTCFGGRCESHLPYVADSHPCFFPCSDTLQEGRVILLPRKGEYSGFKPWNICLCLDGEDLDHILDDLDRESWIEPSEDFDED